MRILKGTLLGMWLLGMWLFGFGTITLLLFLAHHHLPSNSTVSVTSLTRYTIQNPLWWGALVLCLVLGFLIARKWSGRTISWVALGVTGLIPIGVLTLFFVSYYYL
jgi:hypothetical protein